MYQESVLSHDFIKFIEENHEEYHYGTLSYRVLNQLAFEKIFIDENGRWKGLVDKIIQASPKREALMAFFAGWQQNIRFVRKKVTNKIPHRKFSNKNLE